MIKILLVEDDAAARITTRLHLKSEYEVIEASNGKEALEIFDRQHIDLVITDVMMPHMDGYEFAKLLRERNREIPLIFLTAKQKWSDKKQGFAMEIDDYLTKPVNYEELLWRIKALFRRAKINTTKKITIGTFTLYEKKQMVIRETEQMLLPKKEFELLYKLLSYPGMVFTKVQLLDDIWGYDSNSDENTVKTHMNRLRKRFANCEEFEIVTVRGLGYKGVIKCP